MDYELTLQANELLRQTRPIELVALLLSSRVTGVALLIGFAALLSAGRRPAWLIVLLLALTVAATDGLCHYVLKAAIERARPCQLSALFYTPAGCGTGFSMPSNHAANAFAVATLVTLWWRGPGVLAFALATAIAASRVFLGVHYPSDLFGGLVVGLAVALPIGLIGGKRVRDRAKKIWEQ